MYVGNNLHTPSKQAIESLKKDSHVQTGVYFCSWWCRLLYLVRSLGAVRLYHHRTIDVTNSLMNMSQSPKLRSQ